MADYQINYDVSPDCFVHRVAALPLVSFSAQQALSAYGKTKNYNSLLNMACSAFETGLSFAVAKAEPIYHRMETPLMKASVVACKGLDQLENRVPAIKMTPEEVREAGLEYYNNSYAKRGADTIAATKKYGTEKMEQTKELCWTSAKLAIQGSALMAGAVRHPWLSFNCSLDYCDSLIDRYVAENTENVEVTRKDSSGSCVEKVHHMSGKFAHGVRVKTSRQLQITRQRLNEHLDNFQGALDLIQYARSTADWAGKSASANLDHLRNNAVALVRNIDAQAKKYNISPDILLLRWIKAGSHLTAILTNQFIVCGSYYLPKNVQASLEPVRLYVNDMSITFNEAENLGEIKEEFLSETKEKLSTVQQHLTDALDYVADYPPISWMHGYWNKEGKLEPIMNGLGPLDTIDE